MPPRPGGVRAAPPVRRLRRRRRARGRHDGRPRGHAEPRLRLQLLFKFVLGSVTAALTVWPSTFGCVSALKRVSGTR